MEPVGVALGALVLIKPLCITIQDTWTDHRSFGKDAERLRLRFSVQAARLDSFELVLFKEDKFLPSITGRLIDHLPLKICDDLIDLLRQLYGMLLEYTTVKSRYEIESRGDADRAAKNGQMTPEERMNSLIIGGSKADALQQKSVSWMRKMAWAMWEKRGAEKIVTDFEQWTERMKSLLEVIWWPSPFFETISKLRTLEEDADAGNIGLTHGIGIRKLLASQSTISPATKKSLEIARIHFLLSSRFGDYELGFLKQDNTTPYLVEYKSYERDSQGAINPITHRRILQLAALLNEAATTDARFKVCQCINYFDDASQKRFGFVYALPRAVAQPITLSAVMTSKRLRPTLRTRIRLAHTLAESLQTLHSFGWIHKSLRSDIILFFPSSAAEEDDDALNLHDPRITGFEYARLESDFSSARPEMEIGRNLYRHPVRWGQPSERFTKIHDIYALGVILLELGLWERVNHLDKGTLLKATDPNEVQQRLLKHAEKRLGFYTGETYRNVVVACLGSKEGVVEGFKEVINGLARVGKEL